MQAWFVQQHLLLPEIEYVLHEAGKIMHRNRDFVMRLPDRSETPFELLALTRPRRIPEDDMPAKLEYCVEWLSRWLPSCLPREEALQDIVLRSTSRWAQGGA
jgi:hypothetical protein